MPLRLLVVGSLLFVLAQSLQAASNPVPFIGQPLAPTSAKPGTHGLTLTVSGTGFVSGSLVQWNGQALPTTLVSGESVTATVPASSLAQAGTGVVTVVNPGPGGGSSNLAFFEVTRATPTAIMFEIRTDTGPNTNSLVAGDFNGDGKLLGWTCSNAAASRELRNLSK
jgi:hypothetical protein